VGEPRAPASRIGIADRSPFQRDRDRIIHSTAFRRLKHKTQVFVYHEGDHYRTRLTHSLEVAQIARTICRTLRLDEDLGEAVALAHDLGHTPFGHAGEEALHAAMKPFGGFDHNAQTLRILTKLEERYAEFNGLNLTWETLEGAVKHNGPLLKDGRVLPTCRRRSSSIAATTISSWMATPGRRRRSRRSATTSPTTTTTSTTACAPGCSRSPTCATCRWSARCS
jgi:predicted deoxyguanosinetriphosphate triphosphohydrolase